MYFFSLLPNGLRGNVLHDCQSCSIFQYSRKMEREKVCRRSGPGSFRTKIIPSSRWGPGNKGLLCCTYCTNSQSHRCVSLTSTLFPSPLALKYRSPFSGCTSVPILRFPGARLFQIVVKEYKALSIAVKGLWKPLHINNQNNWHLGISLIRTSQFIFAATHRITLLAWPLRVDRVTRAWWVS